MPGQAATTSRRPGFAHRATVIISALQLICGMASIMLGISEAVIAWNGILNHSGNGIWSGVIYFVAGILGMLSWKYKTSGLIISCMVMSIIASVAAGIQMLISSAGASQLNGSYHWYYRSNAKTSLVLALMLVFLSIIEFVMAILSAAFGCRAVCCGQSRPYQGGVAMTSGGQIQYMPPAPSGGQVILVTGMQNQAHQSLVNGQPTVIYPINQPPVAMQVSAPPSYTVQGAHGGYETNETKLPI